MAFLKKQLFLSLLICFYLPICAQYSLKATLLGHSAPVNGLEITADGKKVISCSKDQSIRLWDIDKATQINAITNLPSSIKKIALNIDGTKFYATGYSAVFCYDFLKFKKIKSYKVHTAFVESISISNNLIATTSWRDNSVMIWKSNFKKQTVVKETIWADCNVFTKDGKILITGDHENLIKLWDVYTGELITKLAGHTDWVYSLKLSDDNNLLYSGGFDGTVRVWDLKTQKNITTLKEHKDGIVCIDLSKDGKYLVSAGMDKSIIVWDLQEKKVAYTINDAHDSSILDIKFLEGSKKIISAGSDNKIKIWELTQ